jgi:hypothetical protein
MMRVLVVLVAIAAMAGCSSIKTYPNSLSKNMFVTTKLDSGSVVTGSSAAFDIYRVDAKCELAYEGRVDLDTAKTEVGLPTNSRLYLDFIFSNHNYLLRASSSTRYGLLLTPRAGYSYQVQVQYVNGIYDAAVRETSRGDSGGRVIEQVTLEGCKAKG